MPRSVHILVPEEPIVADFGQEIQTMQVAACGDNCTLASHLRQRNCPGDPSSCQFAAANEIDSPADQD